MSYEGLMQDTVSIKRKSGSKTDRKKVMTSATVTASAVCLIQELSGTLAMTVMGRIPTATHSVFFKSGQDVLENDLLDDGSKTYLVKQVSIVDRPGTAHHLECIVEEAD